MLWGRIMSQTTDVLVIGGGVIGCSVAYFLARAGVKALIVERGEPGREASEAAAGVLAVASGRSKRGPAYELKRASLEMFPSLVEELQELTGIDVEYYPWGLLSLILTEEDEKRLRSLYELRKEQGLPAQWLSPEEVWREEPKLTRSLRGAVLFSGDHHIHNAAFTQALARGAQKLGATLLCGQGVQGVQKKGERITKVRLDQEEVSFSQVVLAAGAWSGEVGKVLGLPLPVQPAKGQMLSCRAGFLRHVIAWQDVYLVPRKGEETLVGSTVEFVGFDKEVTLEALKNLIHQAQTLAPEVGQSSLLRAWAGLRPYSPTRRPILCRAPELPNVLLATGHHRNGILLAPITGKLIAELITTGAPSLSLKPFGLPGSNP